MFFMVLVVVIFTSCSNDEPEVSAYKNTTSTPASKPDIVVNDVQFAVCELTNIKWIAENATFNVKSRSAAQAPEAFVAAKTIKNLMVNVVYSDGSVKQESTQYTETNKFSFSGLSEYREISDMGIFDAQPQISEVEENLVNAQGFLFNFSGVKIYSIVSSEKSQSEINFHGKAIPTCTNEWNLEYINNSVVQAGETYQEGGKLYTPYNVKLTFHASVDGGGKDKEGDIILDVKNIRFVENAPAIEPEPEFVSHVWEDNAPAWQGETLISSGTLSELWSDGSIRNPITKSCELNWSVEAPADQIKYVENLFFGDQKISQKNYIKGTSSHGEFTISKYVSEETLSTNYFSCTFKGSYEKASFVAPNGETIKMLCPELSFSETQLLVGEKGTEGNYEFEYENVSTIASICGKEKTLNTNVKLMVYKEPSIATPVQTGMYIENEHVDGDYIVFDVVKIFDSKPEQRQTLSFAHGCGMEVQKEFPTTSRQYGVLATNPAKQSEIAFTVLGGKVKGKMETWVNTFTYNDFQNTITYYYPTNLTFDDGSFTATIKIENAVVNKTGSETAATPTETTETSKIFNDNIYYVMYLGGSEVSKRTQVVVYTEKVEPEQDPVVPTYAGYHVVAERSGSAYVFAAPNWSVYIAEHIEFENDNDPNDRYTLLKVYSTDKDGNSYNKTEIKFNKKIIGSSNGVGYPAATYVGTEDNWTIGHIHKITSDYKNKWGQMSDADGGATVTIGSLIINASGISNPEISRGEFNSTTKVYTLGGVEYK